jgi:hypothetical protein
MEPIGYPETSVADYKSTMCNIPEKREFQEIFIWKLQEGQK